MQLGLGSSTAARDGLAPAHPTRPCQCEHHGTRTIYTSVRAPWRPRTLHAGVRARLTSSAWPLPHTRTFEIAILLEAAREDARRAEQEGGLRRRLGLEPDRVAHHAAHSFPALCSHALGDAKCRDTPRLGHNDAARLAARGGILELEWWSARASSAAHVSRGRGVPRGVPRGVLRGGAAEAVWPRVPAPSRAERRTTYCGTWVDLPHPVSPSMTTT